jgi:hypothetical protein
VALSRLAHLARGEIDSDLAQVVDDCLRGVGSGIRPLLQSVEGGWAAHKASEAQALQNRSQRALLVVARDLGTPLAAVKDGMPDHPTVDGDVGCDVGLESFWQFELDGKALNQ